MVIAISRLSIKIRRKKSLRKKGEESAKLLKPWTKMKNSEEQSNFQNSQLPKKRNWGSKKCKLSPSSPSSSPPKKARMSLILAVASRNLVRIISRFKETISMILTLGKLFRASRNRRENSISILLMEEVKRSLNSNKTTVVAVTSWTS